MTSATTNIGSLTTTFTPTATNCLSYFQARNGGDTWMQYGTVGLDANACFPSGFNPLDGPYYSPGVCPYGYQYQYTVEMGESTTAATCCPSGYSRQSRGSNEANACYTKFDKNTIMTVSIWTDVSKQSPGYIGTTIRTQEKGYRAYARGIVVRRSGNDPTWPGDAGALGSTKTSTKGNTGDSTPGATGDSRDSASPTSHPSVADGSRPDDGLSSSAKIGIGIGVSLGVLLIAGSAIAAFLLGKRRRRNRQIDAADQRAGVEQSGEPPAAEMESPARQTKAAGVIDETIVRYPGELPAYAAPAELDAVSGKREFISNLVISS